MMRNNETFNHSSQSPAGEEAEVIYTEKESIDIEHFNKNSSDNPELSQENPNHTPEQKKLLSLLETDKILSNTWDYNPTGTARSHINYFGISTAEGITPFNSEGKDIAHQALANSPIGTLRQRNDQWINILAKKLEKIADYSKVNELDKQKNKKLAELEKEEDRIVSFYDDFLKQFGVEYSQFVSKKREFGLDLWKTSDAGVMDTLVDKHQQVIKYKDKLAELESVIVQVEKFEQEQESLLVFHNEMITERSNRDKFTKLKRQISFLTGRIDFLEKEKSGEITKNILQEERLLKKVKELKLETTKEQLSNVDDLNHQLEATEKDLDSIRSTIENSSFKRLSDREVKKEIDEIKEKLNKRVKATISDTRYRKYSDGEPDCSPNYQSNEIKKEITRISKEITDAESVIKQCVFKEKDPSSEQVTVEKLIDKYYREFALRHNIESDESKFEHIDRLRQNDGLSKYPSFLDKIPESDRFSLIGNLYVSIRKQALAQHELSLAQAKYSVNEKAWQEVRNKTNKLTLANSTFNNCKERLMQTSEDIDLEALDAAISEMAAFAEEENRYYQQKTKWSLKKLFSKPSRSSHYDPDNIYGQIENKYALLSHKELSRIASIACQQVSEACHKISAFIQPPTDRSHAPETLILPTGLIQIHNDEKTHHSFPITDISIADFNPSIPQDFWEESWKEYIQENFEQDRPKLVKSLNQHIGDNSLRAFLTSYNINSPKYLISPKSGNLLPSLTNETQELLTPYLEKYSNVIERIQYTNDEPRYETSLQEWENGIQYNLKSINGTHSIPNGVRNAFKQAESGLLVLNMNNIPYDINDNPDTLNLATNLAIWHLLGKEKQSEYQSIVSSQLKISPSSFARTFGQRIYNKNLEKQIVSRLLFLQHLSQWQSNKLEDPAESDFFSQIFFPRNK